MALTRFQDNEKIAQEIEQLGGDLEKLRLAYEQYFLGLERTEPSKLRKGVSDLVRKHSGTGLQNARLKFRLQQMIARYNTYVAYWDRILREMEDGTYTRDVFKAKIHEKARFGAPAAASPAAAPVAKAASPMEQLYRQYVDAKKKCNEDVSSLSLEKFEKTIRAQIETLKQKTGGTTIRFQVLTEGGKAKLKALAQTAPKKTGA